MKRFKIKPLPKNERAINYGPSNPQESSFGSQEAKDSIEDQANSYYEGKSKAGKNDPYFPSQAVGTTPLGEVRDASTKKPYGKEGMGWSEKSGKLGDLDPQETDQPSWVGTWSPLVSGPSNRGNGYTYDENYNVQRPRTYSRQRERFFDCNPEFQDVADHGDWTSYKWRPDV